MRNLNKYYAHPYAMYLLVKTKLTKHMYNIKSRHT